MRFNDQCDAALYMGARTPQAKRKNSGSRNGVTTPGAALGSGGSSVGIEGVDVAVVVDPPGLINTN